MLYTLLWQSSKCYKSNNIVQERFISYYKTNGITSLKKNVDVDHDQIVKIFEEEVNSLLKGKEERTNKEESKSI